MLTLTAGAIGILIARWAADALIAFSPVTFPGFVRVDADRTVLLFTFGVSATMGLLLGLAPMWQMGGGSLASTLKEAGRGNVGRRTAVVPAGDRHGGDRARGHPAGRRRPVDPQSRRAECGRSGLQRRAAVDAARQPSGAAGARARLPGASVGQPTGGVALEVTAAPQSALAIAERVGAVPGVERVGVGLVDSADGMPARSAYTAEGQRPMGGAGSAARVSGTP